MRRREGIRWVGVASGDAGSTGEDGAARMGNRGDGMPGWAVLCGFSGTIRTEPVITASILIKCRAFVSRCALLDFLPVN
jgi:hypothetical protein